MDKTPRVIWITGLSGAGKTTLANSLYAEFKAKNVNVIKLDGDELREVFGIHSNQKHDRQSRALLGHSYSRLCIMLANQGFTVIIATISMIKELNEWNRTNLPNYFEVYLKVPRAELLRRDPKGIYQKFKAGQVSNVAGFDLDVDEPESADIVFDFNAGDSWDGLQNQMVNKILGV